MGSSAKKKKEKQKDFQKPKLKVGKKRPANTNATDTSFASKSVVFKQQNLSEGGRDHDALFQHNLSLLSSKNETQRRDALTYLSTTCLAQQGRKLPQSPSVIVAKAQPLIIDGNSQVRQQLLKLFRALPPDEIGPLDQVILYTRAGMAHLSNDIRISSLDFLDWLLEISPVAVVSNSGGWVKTLRTFQNLLSWNTATMTEKITTVNGTWSNSKPSGNLGSSKLLVRQLISLSRLLTAGLRRPTLDHERRVAARQASANFPLCHQTSHMLPKKSNPFGYLNLFGAPRDVESEVYEDAEERVEVFIELGMAEAFRHGVSEAKKEGGEVGRAAASVDKALKLADDG